MVGGMTRILSRSGNSGRDGGRTRILVRRDGYPFHPTGRAIISTDLEPFIDTILMKEMFTGHEAKIFLGFVVVQTYHALVQDEQ